MYITKRRDKMVKNMDDYNNRHDESRFAKWDKMITSSDNNKKVSAILIIGSIICLIMLSSSFIINMGKPTPQKYDYGLNISYEPQSSFYYIDFTNPNNTVSSMYVSIKIPYSTETASTYTTIYETSTSTFPTNISYKPYSKNMEHIITTTLTKNNSNYTYFFTNTPDNDDKLYDGITKYTENINSYLKINNITS
jgi:hypothetical protein